MDQREIQEQNSYSHRGRAVITILDQRRAATNGWHRRITSKTTAYNDDAWTCPLLKNEKVAGVAKKKI
jgi:hypothetical protein